MARLVLIAFFAGIFGASTSAQEPSKTAENMTAPGLDTSQDPAPAPDVKPETPSEEKLTKPADQVGSTEDVGTPQAQQEKNLSEVGATQKDSIGAQKNEKATT